MIKRLVVEKLYDRFDFDLHFNEDLNLFTGRNGSGKTTLMKLMWGMLSGRVSRSMDVYPSVESLALVFEDVFLFQGKSENIRPILAGEMDLEAEQYEFIAGWNGRHGDMLIQAGIETDVFPLVFIRPRSLRSFQSINQSLFFPTFRRSEGGYGFLTVESGPERNPLGDSDLGSLIRAASNGPGSYHAFVNYSSTTDIDFILTTLHSNIATQTQALEKAQSDFVLERIAKNEGQAEAVLQEIKTKQEETNQKVAALMKPLDNLSNLIATLYNGKGINVSQNLTLGDTLQAIRSEHLSSGEKQMLSFLAYCSICKNTIIFIDEPELSLHPDWQRLLVPMLLDIPNNNQYFMATHSPFIYAKYPEKEINLDADRGGF
jgi:predicted ATP-dependent endonuclease of OLD family